jgi:hypothetical protein
MNAPLPCRSITCPTGTMQLSAIVASAPPHESEQRAHAVHAVKLQSMGHGETTHVPASEVGPHGSPPLAAPTKIVRVRVVGLLPHETAHVLQLQQHQVT